MQYKSLKEQTDKFISIIKENDELMDILDYVSSLNLPNFYIAAGSIFQTIWNYYDNKSLNYGIKDIDVIYFNSEDISVDIDIKYYKLIQEYSISKGYNYEIDVSNEARMHIWKKEHQNQVIEPYKCSEDAIERWIATVHAIGITKDNDDIRVYAPYGLSDIFSKTIRSIKHIDNNKKVKSWTSRFNDLNIINWELGKE